MKALAFASSAKKVLLDIFSMTKEIVSISMRDRFVLKIREKKSVHNKLWELKGPFIIVSCCRNFLPSKIDLQSSMWKHHPEFKFTQMKSNSTRKWLSMVIKWLQSKLAEKYFSINNEDALGTKTLGRLLATVHCKCINKIPLSHLLLSN